MFTFYNDDTIDDPQQMFIRNIYLYDGELTLNEIIYDPDVNVAFSEGSSPAYLPGYDKGLLTTFLTADADTPPGGLDGWGIDPGEYLSVRFNIINPLEYNYGMLLSDITNSTVVIGIKVQGFADGESESLITPIPPSMIIGLLGLGVAGLKLRKFT